MRSFTRPLNIVVHQEMFETVARLSRESGLSRGAIVRQAIDLITAKIAHQDKADKAA